MISILHFLPKKEQEVQELEYSLDEERNDNNTDKEVKGISLENNVITIRVNLNGLTADQVSFYLKDLPEGATIEGTKFENGADATKKKVFVKAKEGTYEFTIKTDEASVNVTVNVVDVTMPKFSRFKELRSEEIVAISDENIKDNSEDVTLKDDGKTDREAEFSGNVNLMKASTDGGKYYKVRIEMEEYDNTKVIAVNQDTLKEYQTEPVAGAANEVYVYLDANEATIPLVLKHKDATDKQVKDERPITVNFNTTSAIWLKDVQLADLEVFRDDKDKNVKPQCNEVNNQIIDVGVDFENLKPITFKVVNGVVSGQVENLSKGEKWIALSLKLTNETNSENARTITNAVYTNDNDENKFILDKLQSGYPQNRIIWVRAEKEGTVKFTLKYNLADNKVEELPITVNLHDITAPLVTSATSSTAGIINTEVDTEGVKVKVDSYKYGMDATVERKETENSKTTKKGRWYSVELKTNVDVSSLVYDKDGKWAEIPADMISDGKIVVWLNADKTDDLTSSGKNVITLANRYTVKVGDAVNGQGVKINVLRTEKSKVRLDQGNWTVCAAGVKKDTVLQELGLHNVNVVESTLKNARKNAGVEAGKLQYNLLASTEAGYENNTKNDVTTTTLTINSNNVSKIKVNGVEGKWIVVHMAVSGNIDTIVDENENPSAIIVDPGNAGHILSSYRTGDNKEFRVPVWINLSSDAVKAVTNAGDKTIEVKFGSTSPVAEHNSLNLKVVDTNPMEEELEVEEAKAVPTSEILDENGEVDEEKAKELVNGGSGKVTDGKVNEENLLNNMQVLANADIKQNIVDDTVYVTVRTDLTKFEYVAEDAKVTIIPMSIDVSALDITDNNIWVWSPISNSWSNEEVSSSLQYNLAIGFREADGSDKMHDEGKSLTKEILITNKNITQNSAEVNAQIKALEAAKAPYIRYVITFENV